jgi:circadian clock protein KaiB
LKVDKPLFSQLFKGIAMFTPGGDLIYGIDPSKLVHWHLHLCAALQEILGLPEPPHFLVPGYTATIDRWLDPRTQQLRTSAEIYRPVLHHQTLLNAVFGTRNLIWQVAPWQEESCDPIVVETYRPQFPQLWEDHDLIVRFERPERFSYFHSLGEGYPTGSPKDSPNREGFTNKEASSWDVTSFPYSAEVPTSANANATGDLQESKASSDSQGIDAHSQQPNAQGYLLRLFVSGNSEATEYTLKSLHQLLEHSLNHPYTLKVIDVSKHPDQAEANQISATPTLLRLWPQPVRRIVGDLNDFETLLRVLAAPEA